MTRLLYFALSISYLSTHERVNGIGNVPCFVQSMSASHQRIGCCRRRCFCCWHDSGITTSLESRASSMSTSGRRRGLNGDLARRTVSGPSFWAIHPVRVAMDRPADLSIPTTVPCLPLPSFAPGKYPERALLDRRALVRVGLGLAPAERVEG